MKTLALTLVLFFSVLAESTVDAQCREDVASLDQSVIEKKVLFEDAHKDKRFDAARGPLNWLLKNAPKLSTNLYIRGAEVYNTLLQQEKDARKKQVYFDSLMIIYDLRVSYCGDEANVISRKAVIFFNYQYNGPRAKEILPLLDKAIVLHGDNVSDGITSIYMAAVKITHELSKCSEDEVLSRYDKITDIINKKMQRAEKEGKSTEPYQKMLDDNLSILSSIVNINCDFVRKKLGPKFKTNPKDIDLAKKIFHFMLKDNCTDDPLWLDAAQAVDAVEKDFALKKYLGLKFLKNDHDKAANFFREALSLAKSPSDKAEVMGYLGFIEEKNGRKPKARELYKQALSVEPGRKDMYERLGDLYYNSYEECAEKKYQAHDRLVFLLAFDMYEKAGDTKKMAAARSSFPSIDDIHLLDYSRGQKIKVECWINEETALRTRD